MNLLLLLILLLTSSANGALYTNMGRSPMFMKQKNSKA